MFRSNAACLQIPPIQFAGEITAAAHELFAAADRFFKGKVFETVERVVMHEGPHGPILRDDFPGEADDAAQLHPPGFNVGRALYRVHVDDSPMIAGANEAPAGVKSVAGARPKANRTTTTISKDANSGLSRSVYRNSGRRMPKSSRCTICMMYQEAASHARSVRNSPASDGNGELSRSPMNPAKTPKGGRPIAARARSESNTANLGMPAARPLIACGSTSSPYLVRMTCQAIMSPQVARPTVPTSRAERDVAIREPAANHQRIEKKERL